MILLMNTQKLNEEWLEFLRIKNIEEREKQFYNQFNKLIKDYLDRKNK